MSGQIIDAELLNRITSKAPLREKAFFTIMRQTGLTAKTISQLKIKNVELNGIIPHTINFSHRLNPSKTKNVPYFIGGEATRYIHQYLASRNDLTPENLLFVTKNDENKAVNPKNVSRTFRIILEKISVEEKKQIYRETLINSYEKMPTLKSLTTFYRKNAEYYEKAIRNNPNKNDYYYKMLYKEKALPFLETESKYSYEITSRREFRKGMKYAEILEKENRRMTKRIIRNTEFISSILTLLYNNSGNPDTRENEVIGDNLIALWKEVREKQHKNLMDSWNSKFKIELLPTIDIVEELTKTLERLKKPYDELERQLSELP